MSDTDTRLLLIFAAIALVAGVPAYAFYSKFKNKVGEARTGFGVGGLMTAFGSIVPVFMAKRPGLGEFVLILLLYPAAGFLTAWEWRNRAWGLIPLYAFVSCFFMILIHPEIGYFGPGPLFFILCAMIVVGFVGVRAAILTDRTKRK
jgi:hypothetical protein